MAGLAVKVRERVMVREIQAHTISGGQLSQLSQEYASKIYHHLVTLESVKANRMAVREANIARLIADHGGYLSDRFIMAAEGINRECFDYAIAGSRRIAKSVIILADGARVYRQRGWWNALRDYLRAFTYYNSQGYRALFKWRM